MDLGIVVGIVVFKVGIGFVLIDRLLLHFGRDGCFSVVFCNILILIARGSVGYFLVCT